MKFEKLFRDVMSKLNQQLTTTADVYPVDVINALNDGIRAVIIDAVANRTASAITVSQTVTPAVDTNFLNIYSKALTRPILQTADIHNVVYNVSATRYTFNISTETSATVNQIGILPGTNNLYVCLSSYTGGVQSDTVSFHGLRNFALNDRGFYRAGQTVRFNNEYWKVLQDFDNDGIEIEEGSLFTRVYWMEIEKEKFVRPVIQPYKRLQSGTLQPTSVPFVSFKDDKVYTSADVAQLYVEYVPEWIDAQLEDVLDLPAEWESQIKNQAIRLLAIKFGATQNEDS
jgi:hypothetical protein